MSVKLENEITVKVICSKNELIDFLQNNGFKEGVRFSLDDYYFIPSNLDITNTSTRDILSKAIIIRYNSEGDKILQRITYKKKNIANNGEIIDQTAINCDIYNIDEAKNIFNAIGYQEIMNIKEDDIVYWKDDLKLAIKFIENSDILIEIETDENTKWNTIDKIKDKIFELNLPVSNDDFFIKKAENELNRILGR